MAAALKILTEDNEGNEGKADKTFLQEDTESAEVKGNFLCAKNF
jgi:hypothetical protein